MNIVPPKNIYPRTIENVRAIFLYFFPTAKNSAIDEATSEFYDDRNFGLNLIEFYAEMVADNDVFFEVEFKGTASIVLKMKYVIDAYSITEEDWLGSKPGIAITKRLRDVMLAKYKI